MFKHFVLLSSLLSLLLSSTVCMAWDKKDFVTYFGTTDKEITVAWDPVENADFYQIDLQHVERDSITHVVSDSSLTTTSKTFKLPRSGHFVPMIRACNTKLSMCSEWTYSTDPTRASVDGEKRAWWLYGTVASPGIITIIKEIF